MSTDPTRSKTLRQKFETDTYNRFSTIKGDVRRVIEKRRVLAPAESQMSGSNSAVLAPTRYEFRFLTTSEKRERFLELLHQRIDEEVLVTLDRDAIRRGQHWTLTYGRTMYAKGVQHVTPSAHRCAGTSAPTRST